MLCLLFLYEIKTKESIIILLMEAKAQRVGPFEKRIHEIDLFRGFLILLVIMDHLFWAFSYFGSRWFGSDSGFVQFFNWYWTSIPREIIQPLALASFCFVSGVSTSFSRNNWKRSIVMVIFWLIIAIGSNVIQLILSANGMDAVMRVDLNIIGVLALCNLIYCFIQKRSWKAVLAAILIGWLMSSYFIPMLRNGLFNTIGGTVPSSRRPGTYYNIPNFYFILFWEYPAQGDYVPLFPFIVFFLFGALFSHFFYREKRQSLFPKRGEWERPICFIGRHTLIIYLSHFFIIRGVCSLITYILTGQFII